MTDAFAAGWRAALDAASEMIADIAASAAHGFLFTESSEETETLRKMLDVIADLSDKVREIPMPGPHAAGEAAE